MTNLDSNENIDLELLGLLQEECAEVVQVASKIRRFGIESYNPYDPEERSNRLLLEDELGDLLLIERLLEESGMIDRDRIEQRIALKRAKLVRMGIIPAEPRTASSPPHPLSKCNFGFFFFPLGIILFLLAFCDTLYLEYLSPINVEIGSVGLIVATLGCALLCDWRIYSPKNERKYILVQMKKLLKKYERLSK